jgi:hypothetical protein
MPTSRVTDTNIAASNITASNITELFTEPEGVLTIDCDCCALRNTDACDDCVVSFLLEREPDDAVVIDADEARAMRMLERAGLVPTLRFSTQAG